MSASASPLLKSERAPTGRSFLHDPDDVCPLCEQQIPHDQYDEIKARIETRQRQTSAELTARLERQFALDKAALLDKAAKEGDEKARLARAEAEAAGLRKLEAAETVGREALQGLQKQIADANAERAIVEASRNAVQAELVQTREIDDIIGTGQDAGAGDE